MKCALLFSLSEVLHLHLHCYYHFPIFHSGAQRCSENKQKKCAKLRKNFPPVHLRRNVTYCTGLGSEKLSEDTR